MKVTIATKFYRTSVTMEHTSDDLDIHQVIEILVRPALLASGFSSKTIENAIGPINDDACIVTEEDDEI